MSSLNVLDGCEECAADLPSRIRIRKHLSRNEDSWQLAHDHVLLEAAFCWCPVEGSEEVWRVFTSSIGQLLQALGLAGCTPARLLATAGIS